MEKEKDELISGSELARRIGTTPQYINNQKIKLKNCKYGKKYYFKKSCLALGYNPNNLQKKEKPKKSEDKSNENCNVYEEYESKKKIDKVLIDLKQNKNKTIEEKDIKEKKPQQKEQPKTSKLIDLNDIDSLYAEILEAIADPDTTYDKLKLDGLNSKAKALKEFELATAQRLKNKQLEENLYSIDEVMNVLNVSVAIFRNALIDLPNNLAGTLEGLSKKQIKDNVTDIVNDILEDFNKTAEKFK